MDEDQKIQQALDQGFSKEDIRTWYLSKGKDLPASIAVTQEEKVGATLPEFTRLAMTAAQGPTFNFADELAGVVSAPFIKREGEPLSDAYSRGRDVYRSAVESYKQEYPIGAPVAQGVASLPLGMLNVAKTALPTLGSITRSAITGIIGGGLSGAGEAESISEIPEKAGISAALGGVLGPATETTMKIVRPVKGAVASQVGRIIPESMKEYMGSSAADIARRRVAQAMLRDGVSAEQIAARMQKLGDDAVIADAAGENLRDLLDTYATLPGGTKNLTAQLIRSRQAGRGARIAESAQKQLSPENARLAETVENLIRERAVSSTPYYEQLKQLVVNTDEDTVKILDAAKKLGAFSNAKKISIAERKPFTLSDTKNLTSASMTDLDLVKRGLDNIIESSQAKTSQGKYTPFGNAVVKLKNDLLEKLDEATKDIETGASIYKQARSAYAGPSQLISSAELGRTIFSKDAGAISDAVKGMTESEFKAFQIGAYENLRSIAGTQSGQTRLLNMWKEPATQEKLKQIFPSERAYRIFASDIAAEARKKQIESVGRGSKTATREAGVEEQGVEMLRDIGALTAASKTADLGSLLSMIQGGMTRTVVPENVRSEVGRILLSRAESGDEIRMLRSALAEMERKQRGGAATSGLIGSQVGAPAIEPVTEALRSLLQ